MMPAGDSFGAHRGGSADAAHGHACRHGGGDSVPVLAGREFVHGPALDIDGGSMFR